MAQGTKIAARTRPRPFMALCMIKAIATPNTVSIATVTVAKKVVFQKAFQKREPVSPRKMLT